MKLLTELREQHAVAVEESKLRAERVEQSNVDEAQARESLERARLSADSLKHLKERLVMAERAKSDTTSAVAAARRAQSDAESRFEKRKAAIEARRAGNTEDAARQRHRDAIQRLDERRSTLVEMLGSESKVAEAKTRLEELKAEESELRDAEKRAEEAREQSRTDEAAEAKARDRVNALSEKTEVLTKQAGMLLDVPCAEAEAWTPAHMPSGGAAQQLSRDCPLLSDASKAREKLRPAAFELLEAGNEASAATEKADSSRALCEQAALECDPVRLVDIQSEREEAVRNIQLGERIADARAQLAELNGERERVDAELERALQAVQNALEDLHAEMLELESEFAKELAGIGRQSTDADDALAEASGRCSGVEAALRRASAEAGDVPAAERELAGATVQREEAEHLLRQSERVVDRLDAQLESLTKKERALEQERQHIGTNERELGDWRLLEAALGPDGIQALEIDAAGPVVTSTVNELLESCYGPRFSVTFETLREKRTKAGEYSEAFDVRVYDAGAERPAEALSGGERVIIGEAIGLALAIFNAQRSGVKWRTLFRDETSGALDPQNAEAYLAMLRKALELGGFDQVLFVSHQREIWERADVRLFVADGRVATEGVSLPTVDEVTA